MHLMQHLSRLPHPVATVAALWRAPHLLLQSSPVSGTAKGKGKLKAGQPLKRSKITKKSSGPAAEPRGRNREAIDRLNRTVDACLSAPTPLRHLTPKDKLREAERRRLGLLTKAREPPRPPPDASPPLMGTPGLDLISLGLVDADQIPKYELTVEDGRRLAKEYSRVLMRRHRARRAAESTLLRLKKEAIAALPEPLRSAALVPDLALFPANRYMATLTPPIEGYIDQIREATKKSIGKEKLR